MRTLLLIALLSIASPSMGGDFDYGSYQTTQLAQVAAGLDIDPRASYWFDAAHPKYHTIATFTGNIRAVTPEFTTYIEAWVKAMGHPAAYHEMFQSEIEIRQGSSTYWLPIQHQLIAPFTQDVPVGAEVHLYVLLIGALNNVPVFAISEFQVASG